MAFLTSTAPGAAGYGNYTVVVATGYDDRVYYNWWKLGEGGHGWRKLEEEWGTVMAPAASFRADVDIATNLNAWVAITDYEGNIYHNATGGGLGSAFRGWQGLGGLPTNVPPAATVTNSTRNVFGRYRPVIVATAPDGYIFYNLSLVDAGWKGPVGDRRTDAAPAAALVGDPPGAYYLFVVIKGLDGQLYLNQGGLDGPFVGWRPMNFNTNVAPGATSAENTSVVVATSTDGRIFYDWWKLGEGGHGWRELEGDGRTDAAPAAALVGDDSTYLFVAIKGLGDQLYLNQGELGGPFVGWQPL